LPVHAPSFAVQLSVRAAIAPPGPPDGELTQPRSQRPVIADEDRLVASGELALAALQEPVSPAVGEGLGDAGLAADVAD